MLSKLNQAVAEGAILPSTWEHIQSWLEAGFLPAWAQESIQYLVNNAQWEELNDRFYTQLTFGTGGLRGRTIGRVISPAERGQPTEGAPAQYPAVGTAYLNDFNVIRATLGLYHYSTQYLKAQGFDEVPSLVIAHDVRYFSRHFSNLTAQVWQTLGGIAYVFDGPRSTPQLSFSVRHLRATAGIVITASHNPPHDNGYKVYFEDGGQVVNPHAEGIMAAAARIDPSEIAAFLGPLNTTLHVLSKESDAAFGQALDALLLDPSIFEKVQPKLVYTAIHGTGQVSTVPALRRWGVDLHEVTSQSNMDGAFPTVQSPNPENPEALQAAIDLAIQVEADAALGTDPDGDRMGAAIRNSDGTYTCLTGNQIGALLAEHRIRLMKRLRILPATGSQRAALIKTFVTTPLQDAIGKAHGLKVINTLTGFKWIGAKLKAYEAELKKALLDSTGTTLDYDNLSLSTRAALHLEHSTFYVFGGEESYGTLGADFVRDKDASGACLIFAEMLATLKAEGKTVSQFLDEIYIQYGYYAEGLLNFVYEGAAGAFKIKSILKAYRENPPPSIGGVAVRKVTDFGREPIVDLDGTVIEPQDFFLIELADGSSYAVRGSGTEPKIKFYLFIRENVANPADLPAAKLRAEGRMTALKFTLKNAAE